MASSKTDQKTIVGVFDDFATAQQAARELQNNGVPADSINIESNQKTGAAGYGGASATENKEGGIQGFFHRIFGGGNDEDDREHYQEAVRRGSAIVAVTAPEDRIDRIARVMNDLGAVDIDRRADYYRKTGYAGSGASGKPYTTEQAAADRQQFRNQQASVPVVEEELQVGKRAVQRGGVRVYSHVIEQPVEENIRLREEHVRVERRPVNRPLEPADAARLRDQTIEVVETAEEPVVSKRARVTEEVVVGKEATERTETIRDNVRRTEVRVDPIQGGNAAGSPAFDYGHRVASDQQYAGRSWEDAENDLRVDYMRSNPSSRWDEVKNDIRRGWEEAAGRR